MNCKVEKSKISGTIVCPANKSYTHRAIFLAALAGPDSRVNNVLSSADTKATIEACKRFGAEIENTGTTIIIKKPIGEGNMMPEIDAGNSGTTIRIATAIASLFPHKTTLTGDSSLQKRPMQPLLNALESIGAKCSSINGKPPVKVIGKISGGKVTISGTISSQFISGLMICAPLTEIGIELNIEDNLVSKPYIDATIVSMRKFGVAVQTIIPYKRYQISPQLYKPNSFTVPIDFSSLALLLSAAVLNGEDMKIKGSLGELPQGDEVFIDILEQLGIKVNISENEISIKNIEKLNGGRFDLSNSPDLLPPLAILSLKSSKPIEIVNVKHARLKETDRITILSRELVKLGIKVQENEDGMVLESAKNLLGAELNSENDHRLFMAFCIAGMYVGNCTITDPQSTEVSFPTFIDDMKKLGAKISLS